jgi:predicted dehydrogenase
LRHQHRRILDIGPSDQWRLEADHSGYRPSMIDRGIYSLNPVRFVMDAEPTAATAIWNHSPGSTGPTRPAGA